MIFFLLFLHLLEDKNGGGHFKYKVIYVLMIRGTNTFFFIINRRIEYKFFCFLDKDKSTRWVWPVNRACSLFHGTKFYRCLCLLCPFFVFFLWTFDWEQRLLSPLVMNIEICLLTKECNWGTNGNSKQIVGRPDLKKKLYIFFQSETQAFFVSCSEYLCMQPEWFFNKIVL